MACPALGGFSCHTNVKTPRWISYWFQRPEIPRLTHQPNWHKNNYADIVWGDMLFGTNENPEDFTAGYRFDDKKEQ